MGHIRRLISIRAQVLIAAAIGLMLLPASWVISWITAAVIHEMGHILAVVACNGRISAVKIGLQGTLIEAENLGPISSALCSLAGPAAGIFLVLLSSLFPRLAICALVQTAFNLLPIWPLDCGRAVAAVCCQLFQPKTANTIVCIIESVVIAFLCFTAVWLSFDCALGLMPILLMLGFLIRHKKIKIPCKRGRLAVQ